MSQPGDLTPDQLQRIFDEEVRPETIDDIAALSAAAPVLVIVGGQPGAGKTRSLDQAARSHPGIVPVVGDDLRLFHPLYRDVMATDPLSMPEVTAQAANAWVHMSLDYLRGQGRSVLLETTLRQPGAVSATLAQFRAAGYATELRILAVPEELSRMGTLTRYVAQAVEDGAGRWAPSRFHDAAYSQAPDTAAAAALAGLVDRVIVVDRNANVLADITIEDNHAAAADDVRAAVGDGRAISSITKAQARMWLRELVDGSDALAGLDEDDPDLLATVDRLGASAARIAAAGWPCDPDRVAAETSRARAAVAALRQVPPTRTPQGRIVECFEQSRHERGTGGGRVGDTGRSRRPRGL